MKRLLVLFAFCMTLALCFSAGWAQEGPKDKDKDKKGKKHELSVWQVTVARSAEIQKEKDIHHANMKVIAQELNKLMTTIRAEVKKQVGEIKGNKKAAVEAARADALKKHDNDLRTIAAKRFAEQIRFREACLAVAKTKQNDFVNEAVNRINQNFMNAKVKEGKPEKEKKDKKDKDDEDKD